MKRNVQTFEEFATDVQKCVTPEDFQNNGKILNIVKTSLYDEFVKCLMRGLDINQAYDATEIIFEISKRSSLCMGDVAELIPHYKKLCGVIKN